MPADVIDLADARIRRGDHMVRGTAADGMVRAIAVTARQTVQTAHENHGTSPLVSAALGRLMMAGLMMGALFKNPDELITLEVRGDGPIGGLTVTANNHGQVKGFANDPHVWLPLNGRGKLDVGGGLGKGTLTVVRDMPGTMPYSSQTELVTGEIGDDLAAHFSLSDQVPTSVGVGVLVDTDTSIRQAGGFIVQLMPGADEELIGKLEDNIFLMDQLTTILDEDGPEELFRQVLKGLEYHLVAEAPVGYRCPCSRERVGMALSVIDTGDLEQMIGEGKDVDVLCQFCDRQYAFTPADLREILRAKTEKEDD